MDIEKINELINESNKASSIGTQKEKSIHQFIKYYITNDSSLHEVKVDKNIIDCFIDNHIYEIQTRAFNKLRDKLERLLDKYPFTIVYPIYTNKILYRVNNQGEIESIRKSPRKESIFTIGDELYKIKKYLKHPNLSIKLFILDINEFQKLRINKRHQERLTPIDRTVNQIIDIIDIDDLSMFSNYIDINDFTKKDFKKRYKLSDKEAGCMLNILVYLNVLEISNKIKNAYIYKIANH